MLAPVDIIGICKTAAKVDALARAGRLSLRDWRRWIMSQPAVRQVPEPLLASLKRWPTTAKLQPHGVAARTQLSELRKRIHGFTAPSPATGMLPPSVWGEVAMSERMPSVLIREMRRHPPRFKPKLDNTRYVTDPRQRDRLISRLYDTDANVAKSWGSPIDDSLFRLGTVMNTKPGTPDMRHELGHFAASRVYLSGDMAAGRRSNTRLKLLLARMRAADPQGFRQLTRAPENVLVTQLRELRDHAMAAGSGIGGARLRNATRADWHSGWADAMRARFGDDAGASAVEHLERNYALRNIGSGELTIPRIPY